MMTTYLKRKLLIAAGFLMMGKAVLLFAWEPPIGIPRPSFGIEETHQMYAGQTFAAGGFAYRDAGHGPYTHYVDNSAACSDANNSGYGSPSEPLCRVPLNLPEGSVVEIHGSVYTYSNFEGSKLKISGFGTASNPIFIRGVGGGAQKPRFEGRQIHIVGAYIIVENLEFYRSDLSIVHRIDGAGNQQTVHHVAVRHSELRHDGLSRGGSAIAVNSSIQDSWVNNIVIYYNQISYYGDWQSLTENDALGVSASTYAEYVWIVDNNIHRLGGDAVRTGTNPAGGITTENTGRYVYIGRNDMHDNRENALDIKVSRDIVISQNKMHGFRGSSSSEGAAFVVHYNAENIWVLFNEIYDAVVGAISTGSQNFSVIGNVFYNISDAAIKFRSTNDANVFGNTVHNAFIGVEIESSANNARVINNIISDISDTTGYHILRAGSISEIHHNMLYQTGGSIRNSGVSTGYVINDPLFVDSALRNFHLQPGSTAIDQGTGAGIVQQALGNFATRYGADIARDIDNTSRPQGNGWDIGAYEFGGGAPPQNNPPAPPKGLRVK